MLSEHFGNPCSAEALSAGLPLTSNVLSPELLPQAAMRAGLSAKLSRKSLDNIPQMLLPCILMLKDQKACILQSLDFKKNTAIISLPETGGEEQLTIEELEAIDDVGQRIAESVFSYLRVEANKHLIHRLKLAGLHFESTSNNNEQDGALAGKKIVVSGVFERFSRNEIKDLIEQHGGENSSSISSKTDYIIAGDQMGPSKKSKAEQLGIPLLSENEFIEMLGI